MLHQSESLFLQKLVLNFLAWDLISPLFTGVIFATFGKRMRELNAYEATNCGKYEANLPEWEEAKWYQLGKGTVRRCRTG